MTSPSATPQRLATEIEKIADAVYNQNAIRSRQLSDIARRVAQVEMECDRLRSAVATGPKAQGPCETTLTPRFELKDCACGTYAGNPGPCMTWNEGNQIGRCVFCDHGLDCHVKLSRLLVSTVGIITAEPITTHEQLEATYQRACRGRHISEIEPILALRNLGLDALVSAIPTRDADLFKAAMEALDGPADAYTREQVVMRIKYRLATDSTRRSDV